MPTDQRVAVELAKGVIEHQMPTGLINVCMYIPEGRDLQSSAQRRMYQEQGINLNPRRLLTDEKKKIRSSTAATIVSNPVCMITFRCVSLCQSVEAH